MAGEEVIITRRGKPVVEIRRSAEPAPKMTAPAIYHWLESRRSTLEGAPMTSVELLNLIYDEPGS
jgi:antitoxin (DNA-binding transcriptional repressor) of toxin-antitoxin stability system